MATFNIYEDTSGEYRWNLKAANGNIIADSGEGYVSKYDCKQGVEWVKTHAKGADVVDQT